MKEQPDITPEVTPAGGKKPTHWERFIEFIKQPVVATIVTAVVSVSGAYFVFAVNDKKANISFEEVGATNFQKLYDLQNAQILNLSIKVDKLTAQNEALRNEISNMKLEQFKSNHNRILFSNSIDSFPFPYWVKSRDGRMIKLNDAFEKAFLKPKDLTRMDYIDHFDVNIWSAEEAADFKKTDMRVTITKKKLTYIKDINMNGKVDRYLVTKFPIFFNGEVIGTAAFALPFEILSKKHIDNSTI